MLAGNAVAALLPLYAIAAGAQQVLTVTVYPSTCSAIYTSGTQSVTVVQSTVTTTVSPTPLSDAAANGGTPFVLQVGQPPTKKTKRQSSSSWVMPNGEITSDGSLAAQFYINNGQLRLLTGGYYSTSSGVYNQTFAAASQLSSINSTFSVFQGVLSWGNAVFTAGDGGAKFYQIFLGAGNISGQLLVQFISDGTTPSYWYPASLTVRGVQAAVEQEPLSQTTSVITSFIMSAMTSSPSGTPLAPASTSAPLPGGAVTTSAGLIPPASTGGVVPPVSTEAPPISVSGIVPYSSPSNSGSGSFVSLSIISDLTDAPIGPNRPTQQLSAAPSSISDSGSGQILPSFTLDIESSQTPASSAAIITSGLNSLPAPSSISFLGVPSSDDDIFASSQLYQTPAATSSPYVAVSTSTTNSNPPPSTRSQTTGGTSSTTVYSSITTAQTSTVVSSSPAASSASPPPASTSYTPTTYSCPGDDGQVVADSWGTYYVIGCGQDTAGGNFIAQAVTDNWNSCFFMCYNSTTNQGAGQCTAFTYSGAVDGDGPGTCFLKSGAQESFSPGSSILIGAIQLAYYSAEPVEPATSSGLGLIQPSSTVVSSSSTIAASSSSISSSSTSTTTTTMTMTSTTTSTTQPTITTTSAATSSSTKVLSSSSSSSKYLILASPTPCDFGDPAGTDEDDSFCEIDLPSSITMYTVTALKTFASTNGYISMTNGSSQYNVGPLPFSGIPATTVCPLFDDLYLYGTSSPAQGIFYQASSTGITYEYYLGTAVSSTAIAHFTVSYTFAVAGVFTYTYYNIENGVNGGNSSVGSQGLNSAGAPIGVQYEYMTANLAPGAVVVCNTLANNCARTV